MGDKEEKAIIKSIQLKFSTWSALTNLRRKYNCSSYEQLLRGFLILIKKLSLQEELKEVMETIKSNG